VTLRNGPTRTKEARDMVLSTKMAAVVMGGLLLAAVYTPAWAGPANDASTAGTSSAAAGADRSLVSVLSPLLNVSTPHQAQKNCKPATKLLNRSRLGDQPGGAIHRVTRPEKSGGHCEVQPGFGTAKAVIAPGGRDLLGRGACPVPRRVEEGRDSTGQGAG
jgi:hypothetical protein